MQNDMATRVYRGDIGILSIVRSLHDLGILQYHTYHREMCLRSCKLLSIHSDVALTCVPGPDYRPLIRPVGLYRVYERTPGLRAYRPPVVPALELGLNGFGVEGSGPVVSVFYGFFGPKGLN